MPDEERRWAGGERHESIIQALRDRAAGDREAREKQQLRYRQSLATGQRSESDSSGARAPCRLHRFRTKVPCRVTPEARALLDRLGKLFPGGTIAFRQVSSSRRQAILLTRNAGAEPREIGWLEHCVETDPMLCHVRNQGLTVETDGGTKLVMRFRHPATAVRMSSRRDALGPRGAGDDMAGVDFAEIRTALEPRPSDEGSSPRLVRITHPEARTLSTLGSRDYQAFYVRFKLEVQAGIWRMLTAMLSSAPDSQWYRGSYYTLVRELDATDGRIHQRTVDDTGGVVDIGANRIYDAAFATDTLLLYLDGDDLADFAAIYFALQSLGTADARHLREELFGAIRHFWAGAQSLASRYCSDLPAVVRMSHRVVPMPAQALLLKQDWINLRQMLVDRYGDQGRKAADLAAGDVRRPRLASREWPFAYLPAGDVNVGLRLVYRQEWRHRGTAIGQGDAPRSLDGVLKDAVKATVESMKWPLDPDGAVNIGARALAARTDMGLESECRESSRDTSARLGDIVRRMASGGREEINRYEVATRPAAIQSVVLVAERLPTPAEIDLAWVRRHDWILAGVLLDESFRDALDTIGRLEKGERDPELDAKRDRLYEHLRDNILHYQRAIWQREDPQQRRMRYRKSGTKVPLEWRFELESGGALTIGELGERLATANVDGQFAAYAAGPEADLDQVIDPAGPIGYCGNYAVYHMRPELGSADLFSMLHFFKSPYLHWNAETGEPEVDDPAEVSAADEASDVSGAEDASAEVEPPDDAVDAGESLDYRLIDESSPGIERLSVNGHRDSSADWTILADGGDRVPGLRAGRLPAAPEARIVRARDDATPTLIAVAGARPVEPEDRLLAARDDGHFRLGTTAGEKGAPIVSSRDGPWATSVRGGRPHDPDAPVMIARGNQERIFTACAGARGARLHEPVIVARKTRVLRIAAVEPTVPAPAPERVVLSSGDAERPPTLRAGRAHHPDTERLMLTARDVDRTAKLRAGDGAARAREPAILARDDGSRIGAGRRHEWEIRARGEGARLTARAGQAASRPHQRMILALENERLRPSLVAG